MTRRLATLLLWLASTITASAELKLGIIGTDGSHSVEFTRVLYELKDLDARVVAAVKGGSPDMEHSIGRVDAFARDLRSKWGVEFVPDIKVLCRRVDAVLVLSIDGRRHLAEVREALAGHKPVFVDKPLAASVADALEIARLATQSGLLVWSTSNFRYSEEILALRKAAAGNVLIFGPGRLEPRTPLDLSYEGIHAAEMLFTILGTGVAEVSRFASRDDEVITGRWKNGRLGTLHLHRPSAPWGAFAFPSEPGIAAGRVSQAIEPLLRRIVQAFRTGEAPVPMAETLEIIEFLHAAQMSKAAGGCPEPLLSNR